MLFFFFVGTTDAHPVIHLRNLELPEAADPVSWQTLAVDLAINRVASHAEVLGNFLDRNPRLTHDKTSNAAIA